MKTRKVRVFANQLQPVAVGHARHHGWRNPLLLHSLGAHTMKRIILATALSLACAAAFAQSDPYAVLAQQMQQSIQQSMQGFQQATQAAQAQQVQEQQYSQQQFDNLQAINQQADDQRAQEQQDYQDRQALDALQEENAALQQAQQQAERDAAQDPDDGG